jgi:hypothetical protein
MLFDIRVAYKLGFFDGYINAFSIDRHFIYSGRAFY